MQDPLMLEPMPPLRMFFSLHGRISRRQFWLWGVAGLLGMTLLAHGLLGVARVHEDRAEALVNAALLWPAVAISAKRWHDRDRSGWWVLVNLVPVVGWLWSLLDNGCVRGTRGPNRYGDDPVALRLAL